MSEAAFWRGAKKNVFKANHGSQNSNGSFLNRSRKEPFMSRCSGTHPFCLQSGSRKRTVALYFNQLNVISDGFNSNCRCFVFTGEIKTNRRKFIEKQGISSKFAIHGSQKKLRFVRNRPCKKTVRVEVQWRALVTV